MVFAIEAYAPLAGCVCRVLALTWRVMQTCPMQPSVFGRPGWLPCLQNPNISNHGQLCPNGGQHSNIGFTPSFDAQAPLTSRERAKYINLHTEIKIITHFRRTKT